MKQSGEVKVSVALEQCRYRKKSQPEVYQNGKRTGKNMDKVDIKNASDDAPGSMLIDPKWSVGYLKSINSVIVSVYAGNGVWLRMAIPANEAEKMVSGIALSLESLEKSC